MGDRVFNDLVTLTRTSKHILAHGSAVALNGHGVLFIGPSGAGKSAMCLGLMSLGAELVGDDRVVVREEGGKITMSPPPEITGKIEARGIGIFDADPAEARLSLVVDLGSIETERLPQRRATRVLDTEVELLHKVESAHFLPALLHYLKRMEHS